MRVLEYVQDPEHQSRNTAWMYAALSCLIHVFESVAENNSAWMGRKVSGKIRAILTAKIYEKSLRRKISASRSQQKDPGGGSVEASQKDHDEQASSGKIVNLMSFDSLKVSDVFAYLHFLFVQVPMRSFLAIFLLYQFLGSSSFAGIMTLSVLLPISAYIAKRFTTTEKNILARTDERVHTTNEVLRNIRIIKYFAWENVFENQISEKRATELRALRERFSFWIATYVIWWTTPMLMTFSTFWVYVKVQHQPLVPSVAFASLSLFELLRAQLDRLTEMIARVQEGRVSLGRIEEYLNEEETQKYHQLGSSLVLTEPQLGLEKATLQWPTASRGAFSASPGSSTAADNNSQAEGFRLIGVDVKFRVGALNIIAGPTGSGKTSMLMALLGEMQLLSGFVYLPGGGADRNALRSDPETGLTESIAYCAQEAWLINATVRENIVFSSNFDETRYAEVTNACALELDLKVLREGDQTLVGDKGLSLSGGQKQRISLARAMYSHARHLLLDDCLSAVDSHTAQHIVQNAFLGPIMHGRTCVLVTHNVSLVSSYAEYIVLLSNGRVAAQGLLSEVAASPEGAILLSKEETRGASPSSVCSSSVTRTSLKTAPLNSQSGKKAKPKQLRRTALEEKKAEGSIKWSTIFNYLVAMGPWYYWVIAITLFPAAHVASVLPNLWIKEWANSYVSSVSSASISNQSHPPISTSNVVRQSPVDLQSSSVLASYSPYGSFSLQNIPGVRLFAPDQGTTATYYLMGYLFIALGYLLIATAAEATIYIGSLRASRIFHSRLLKSITRATFRFFDSTPLGQLMNRFSKDIAAIDQELALQADLTLQAIASVLVVIVTISCIIPMFLFFAAFFCLIIIIIGILYLPVGRDLKRMHSVMQSPLFQHFGETLNGVVTIRAYGDYTRFLIDNCAHINASNRPYYYIWAVNRWLSARLDVAGALVSGVTASFVILQVGSIDAGAAGLALTYAATFPELLMYLVRSYSQAELQFNSVERVEEYIDVEHEGAAILPDSRPPSNWPADGGVEFKDYTTRYRPELEPVLHNVSFKVLPGERVGIVGRTGAGKSSLALALLRGLEATGGQIIIDGIDISTIGLQDLRREIIIVPQDPTLFTGDIRSNLDLFGQYTDEEIYTALLHVHLIDSNVNASTFDGTPRDTRSGLKSNPDNINIFHDLNSPIAESGSNVSQGQRQLLCLARAILRNPSVLLMDEATASIDFATDERIQETLRGLKGNTIITIAHRLNTIIDYDKVLVLDQGAVKEYDSPWELINRRGGIFRQMCQDGEDFGTLYDGAKMAYENKTGLLE